MIRLTFVSNGVNGEKYLLRWLNREYLAGFGRSSLPLIETICRCNNHTQEPRLWIASVADVTQHIPIDSGLGHWESVAIPFSFLRAFRTGASGRGGIPFSIVASLMRCYQGFGPRSPDAALPFPMTSDILSDMKTFTVRDLDRQPAVVLDACDKEGAVRIRRRNGRSYRLQAEAPPDRMRLPSDFASRHLARVARTFPKPIPDKQTRMVDKLLAGE